MPRKKKKAVDGSANKVLNSASLPAIPQAHHHLGDRNAPPPQAWHKPADNAGQGGSITGKLDEDAKMKELRYLQDMFAKKLDPVVVHMIMEDSDFKVDVALETLFKLAEDGQPREEEGLSFKNVYPVEPSIDKQEAWGAAIPGNDGAVSALPIATASSGSTFQAFRTQRRSSEDGYPALPSQHLDTSEGIPPGLASIPPRVASKPTLNGYHSSSKSTLPNQSSTISSSNWAPKPPSYVPTPASILVDNSIFDFDLSSDTAGGARPKMNSKKTQKKKIENKSKPEGSKASSEQYFRLPLPGEEELDAYRYYYQDAEISSGNVDAFFGSGENKDVSTFPSTVEELSHGNDLESVKPSDIDARYDTKKEEPDILSVQDIEASILDNVGGQGSTQGDEVNEGIPHLKLFEGQQLVFPDIEGSVSGGLYPSDASRSDHCKTSKSVDDTEQIPVGVEEISGIQDDSILTDVEQELDDYQPQASSSSSLIAGVSHIITTEDDDLISELMDSDDDLAVEEELEESRQEAKMPVGPPRNLSWQKSLTENEEWEKLMKEIHASADDIHVEPIAESVQAFIKENSTAATVDKWFSPVSDSSEESIKPLFPEYRLFPSLGGPDSFLDVASDDDTQPTRRKSKILEKLKYANNQQDSGDDGKQTTENESENASQRSTPQLPVIKAELSVKAKEFVPQPAPEKTEDSDDSESSNVETIVKPIPKLAPVLVSVTPPPPSRSPFPMHGGHPQMPPFRPGFPNQPMGPGPFGMIGPNHMSHPYPPGVMPPPPPFQGRVVRPHAMPPRSRMPMAPRPGGPMPPGAPLRPMAPHHVVGFPPGNQPFGIPPRNLVPHMGGPPGAPLRMVSHSPLMTGPASGMQARFPAQGSPQHHPATFRHPSLGAPVSGIANSPSPPFSRPSIVPSPPTSQTGPKPGFIGAPRWPVVHSNIVKRGSDVVSVPQMKPFPSDKKVMCLMRGAPGSGKSTLARQLKGDDGVMYSTDDFFKKDGQYIFDHTQLAEAHEWNQKRAREACEAGTSPIIIDNTNSQRWEMKPYVHMAIDNGYQVEFQEPTTPWRNTPSQLAKRNSHSVPVETIAKLLDRYEHNVTVENILKPQKRKGKKNALDGKEHAESSESGQGKKNKQSTNNTTASSGSKNKQNTTNDASKSRLEEDIVTAIVADIVTASVAKLQQLSSDEDDVAADDDISDKCEVSAETPVMSPSRKLQLSIPLEIFNSVSRTEEKSFLDGGDEDDSSSKEQLTSLPKNDEDSSQDEMEFVDFGRETSVELPSDGDDHHMHHNDGGDDDDAQQLSEGDDKVKLESLEEDSDSSHAKHLNTADNMHDSDTRRITCVQVDIRSSLPVSLEYQKIDDSNEDTKSDQFPDELEKMGGKTETVEMTSSSDCMNDEMLKDFEEKVEEERVNSIPNSAELSTIGALPDNINAESLSTNLVKARQYAMEITKQSVKYADAPCSQCSDKLDVCKYADAPCSQCSDKLDVYNSCDVVNEGQIATRCSTVADSLTEDKTNDCTLVFADAEELDSDHVEILDGDIEILNQETRSRTIIDGVSESRSTEIVEELDKGDDDDDDPFEDALSNKSDDALSDGSDNQAAADTSSSNVSFITPPQVSPESDRNKVALDTKRSEEVSSEEAKTKCNQRQSPRLAAVFSLAMAQDNDKAHEERVNWVFPDLTETKANCEEERVEKAATQVVECSCQTEHEVFAIVQKLGSGKLSEEDVNKMGYHVIIGHIDTFLHYLVAQMAEVSSKGDASMANDDLDIPTVRKLDQSTMTEDMPRDRSFSTNLATLAGCFPSVPVESLQDVLTDCFGDVEWATNLLIDSGYMEPTQGTEPDGVTNIVGYESPTQSMEPDTCLADNTSDENLEQSVLESHDSVINTKHEQSVENAVKHSLKENIELPNSSEQTFQKNYNATQNIEVENIPADIKVHNIPTDNVKLGVQDTQGYAYNDTDITVCESNAKEPTSKIGSFVESRLGIDENEPEGIENNNLAVTIMPNSGVHPHGTNLEFASDSEMQNDAQNLQENKKEKALGNLISGLIQDGIIAAVQSESTNQSFECPVSTNNDLASSSGEPGNRSLTQQHEEVKGEEVSQSESESKSHVTVDGLDMEKQLNVSECGSENKLVHDDKFMQNTSTVTYDAITKIEKPQQVDNGKDIQSEGIIETDLNESSGRDDTLGTSHITKQESICSAEILDNHTPSSFTKEKLLNTDTGKGHNKLKTEHSESRSTQAPQQTSNTSTPLHHRSPTSQSKTSENVVTVPLELLVPLSSVNPEGALSSVNPEGALSSLNLESALSSINPEGATDNLKTKKEHYSICSDCISKFGAKSSSPVERLNIPTAGGLSSNSSVLSLSQNNLDSSRKNHSSSEMVVLGEASAKDDVWKVVVSTSALTTSEERTTKPVIESIESISNSNRFESSGGDPCGSLSSSSESSPTRLALPKLRCNDNETSSLESSPKRSLDSDTDSDSFSNPLDAWGLDDGMILQLDAAFGLQLQEMFGPVGFHLTPGGMSEQDLEVKISHDLAKQLHTLWASTLQQRFDVEQEQMSRMIKTDEQLARELQQEEELIHQLQQEEKRKLNQLSDNAIRSGARPKTKLKKSKPLLLSVHHNSSNKGLMLEGDMQVAQRSWWQQADIDGRRRLQEIMDEETARQLVDEDVASVSSNEDTVQTLAVKIKRKQLYQQFPTVDTSLLDDIYAKHEYELIPTVRDAERLLGDQTPPRDVYTDEELRRLEQRQMEQAEKESLALIQQAEDDEDSSPEVEVSSYQSFDEPHYHDYRAEATMHYQQRQECFQKAAAAYQRGLKDLASFYSRQGHQHTDLLRAANRRASEAILEARQAVLDENILDLHGLHVEEAIEKLADVLKERSPPTMTSSDIPPLTQRPSHLMIITGRGKNSRGGVARIKPAVATYLKNNNYRFTIPNAGLIKVLW